MEKEPGCRKLSWTTESRVKPLPCVRGLSNWAEKGSTDFPESSVNTRASGWVGGGKVWARWVHKEKDVKYNSKKFKLRDEESSCGKFNLQCRFFVVVAFLGSWFLFIDKRFFNFFILFFLWVVFKGKVPPSRRPEMLNACDMWERLVPVSSVLLNC